MKASYILLLNLEISFRDEFLSHFLNNFFETLTNVSKETFFYISGKIINYTLNLYVTISSVQSSIAHIYLNTEIFKSVLHNHFKFPTIKLVSSTRK